MKYTESSKIFDVIKGSEKILVNLHRSPDPDSFSSAFSLYYFLKSLGKDVDVILTKTSDVGSDISQLKESEFIKKINFKDFDFKKYDLFLSPDSAAWLQVTDDSEVELPEIPLIVLDHHVSNEKFGSINLVDVEAASCAEVIFNLFSDFGYEFGKRTAELLLTGIIADTGGFAFSDNPETLRIAASLMDCGAKKTEILNKLYRNHEFEQLKYWGECLTRLEFDKECKFIWVALPFDIESKYKIEHSDFATMFVNTVEGTNFGIVMTEDKKDQLSISFRSRDNYDISKLAQTLGGGGHKMSAGAKISGLSFDRAVEKVLTAARKYAKKYK